MPDRTARPWWLLIARCLRCCLRPLGRAVVAYGVVYLPDASSLGPRGCYAPGAAAGLTPPRGHPERLRPDVPLTALESELDRELRAAVRRRAGRLR